MACKSCINDLGEFPHNRDVVIDEILASVTGCHIVRLEFAGNIRYLKVYMTAGDELTIPKGKLNEDATYEFTVEDPNGANITVDSCQYFRLKTYISNDGNCNPTSCPDTVGGDDGYC